MLRSRSEQDIERLAAEDADNPATTEEDWADAVIGLPVLKTPVNAKFDADCHPTRTLVRKHQGCW
jgi:hypothetical protein